mgnify:CR=1 FL=1
MSDKPRETPDVFTVRLIANYWRLQRNGYLVATFNTKGAALAGMAVEKRRARLALRPAAGNADTTTNKGDMI